jgi:hypothetical protein
VDAFQKIRILRCSCEIPRDFVVAVRGEPMCRSTDHGVPCLEILWKRRSQGLGNIVTFRQVHTSHSIWLAGFVFDSTP